MPGGFRKTAFEGQINNPSAGRGFKPYQRHGLEEPSDHIYCGSFNNCCTNPERKFGSKTKEIFQTTTEEEGLDLLGKWTREHSMKWDHLVAMKRFLKQWKGQTQSAIFRQRQLNEKRLFSGCKILRIIKGRGSFMANQTNDSHRKVTCNVQESEDLRKGSQNFQTKSIKEQEMNQMKWGKNRLFPEKIVSKNGNDDERQALEAKQKVRSYSAEAYMRDSLQAKDMREISNSIKISLRTFPLKKKNLKQWKFNLPNHKLKK